MFFPHGWHPGAPDVTETLLQVPVVVVVVVVVVAGVIVVVVLVVVVVVVVVVVFKCDCEVGDVPQKKQWRKLMWTGVGMQGREKV